MARVVLLGFFAVLFFILMALGLFFVLGSPPAWLADDLARYWPFYGMVLFFIGWVAYFWDLFHNAAVPREKRQLWAALLFFAGPWAMPFYFWFYVRGPRRPGLVSAPQ